MDTQDTQNKHSFKLIMAGNTNIPAVINVIIQATKQAKENNKENKGFDNFDEIHIFHTQESIHSLMTSELPWQEELHRENISTTSLIHHVTSIEVPNDEKFDELVKQLGAIVNPLNNTEYYVDLTNGISSLKTILSVFAYVLDIKNIYVLEVDFSKNKIADQGNVKKEVSEEDKQKIEEEKKQRREKQIKSFYQHLSPDQIHYKKFPPIDRFDKFGKLSYTEILRYRSIIDDLTNNLGTELKKVVSTEDIHYIKASLLSGINSRLRGEVSNDYVEHHYSVFSFANAIEKLTDLILFGINSANDEEYSSYGTLGNKLGQIRDWLKQSKKHPIDIKTLSNLTQLITQVRNDVTHSNSELDRDKIASVQSYLFSNLSIAFTEFMMRTIAAFMNEGLDLVQPKELQISDTDDSLYYFGFDGDSTGDYIEEAFKDNQISETEIKKRSNKIKNTILDIKKMIQSKNSKNTVIFAEGDNILFKSKYDAVLINNIQEEYKKKTRLSSSIGFGKTLKEATIALRLAKAKEGNSVVGISIQDSDPEKYEVNLELSPGIDSPEDKEREQPLES